MFTLRGVELSGIQIQRETEWEQNLRRAYRPQRGQNRYGTRRRQNWHGTRRMLHRKPKKLDVRPEVDDYNHPLFEIEGNFYIDRSFVARHSSDEFYREHKDNDEMMKKATEWALSYISDPKPIRSTDNTYKTDKDGVRTHFEKIENISHYWIAINFFPTKIIWDFPPQIDRKTSIKLIHQELKRVGIDPKDIPLRGDFDTVPKFPPPEAIPDAHINTIQSIAYFVDFRKLQKKLE